MTIYKGFTDAKILMIKAQLMWVQKKIACHDLFMQKSQEFWERCRQKKVWYKWNGNTKMFKHAF